MKEVLDEYGILFVSDEVQTGWGRTGEHFWGIQAHGVTPDAMTFAKGLGNGLAIGGVVARGELLDSITANSISTFGGNPLSTRAALATLDYLLSHDLQANARKMGGRLRQGLEAVAERCQVVGEVRGKGLMIGVELVEAGSTEPSPAAATWVLEETKRRGLLIGKGGLYGNVLRVAPPLSVGAPEIEEGLEILGAAIVAAEKGVWR
jgi:4-aminobutyrate aminotransferase